LLTIAGSGPSAQEYGKPVTIATKKKPLPSDYVVCHYAFQYKLWKKTEAKPILYHRRCGCGDKKCGECTLDAYYMDASRWDAYFKQFARMKQPPQRMKPSLGTKAVFAAIELFNPTEVGLIGYDYILDGAPKWGHDAIAEKRCIESLVKIIDLRHG
jgi:hypothetical protein